jgi:hypothetical protein
MSNRYYAYHGNCLLCGSKYLIETKQNYGKDHYIPCPICNNGIGDIDIMRVDMGKNDKNKVSTLVVKGAVEK